MTDNSPVLMFNQDMFQQLLKPYFDQHNFSPCALTVFPLAAPFWLPVPEGSSFTYPGDKDDSWVTLVFSSLQDSVDMLAGSKVQKTGLSIHRSRVEMIYSTATAPIQPDTDYLSNAFDTCLGRLNAMVLGYLVSTNNYRTYRLSREMFDPMLLFTHFDVPHWDKPFSGIFMLHPEVPTDATALLPAELKQVVQLSWAQMKGLNPFMTTVELAAGAERHVRLGFYKEAVMLAQSSVESFVRTTFQLLLESEGVPAEEVIRALEDTAFMSIIKRNLHSRLGGSWTLDGSGPVATWYSTLYSLRNRVSHGAYQPGFREVVMALDAGQKFRNFISQRIKACRPQYPTVAQWLS